MSAESHPEEVERKYLLTSDAWKTNTAGTLYRQGYLSRDPDRTVRIRLEGDKAKLTIKGRKVSATAPEFEYSIPGDHAEYLLEHLCLPHIVEKRRHRIEYRGLVWEVDEFLGLNEGLVVAEIELEAADQVFDKPGWIGAEVTADFRYANSELSRNPYREWTK